MGTIRTRFILVAVAVGCFAIAMAAFLNYFKYRNTVAEIVKARVLVVGRGIENTIQASLGVGLQFSELSMLGPLLEREKAADRLIRGIDVFDAWGQVLYSTDAARLKARVPPEWLLGAERARGAQWSSDEPAELVAGMTIRNDFDLPVGHVAMRYSRDELERAAREAGREILLATLGALALLCLIAPLAITAVMRRFERDLRALEAAVSGLGSGVPPAPRTGSPFLDAMTTLHQSIEEANKSLDDVRAKLDAAG